LAPSMAMPTKLLRPRPVKGVAIVLSVNTATLTTASSFRSLHA
jgi:hypothetical protein